jgi:hypothetical protein
MNEPRPTLPQGNRFPVGQPGAQQQQHQHGPPKIGAMPIQQIKPDEGELDPIGLVDEVEEVEGVTDAKKIKAFGVVGGQRAHTWKRTATTPGTGACRVRSFHGKLSDQGMTYLDDQINEWLDQHPEVEVKFVTSTVGQFEGKIREPALIMNLWY